MHSLVLLAVGYLSLASPLAPPPPRSIAVELLSEQDFQRLAQPVVTALPQLVPPAPPLVAPRPLVPTSSPPGTAVEKAKTTDGMIPATKLLAGAVLADPENIQMKETLPKMARPDRITQLCNIEGMEQLRLLKPEGEADSVAPSAFAETIIKGYDLEAPGGAYRSHRKWYAVRFTCTVSPDFASVRAFRFEPGVEIPESEWESHDLIAVDDDE